MTASARRRSAGARWSLVEQLRGLGHLLLRSVGGTVVLLVIAALDVYVPRGLTRYGWTKRHGGT